MWGWRTFLQASASGDAGSGLSVGVLVSLAVLLMWTGRGTRVQLVGPDLEPEHRLDGLAGGRDALVGVGLESHRPPEPVKDLAAHLLGEHRGSRSATRRRSHQQSGTLYLTVGDFLDTYGNNHGEFTVLFR